ncbi:alpha/beta fold hydrolase [Ruegeria sp. HKCCD4332]|uniref:alpha/beta fold hydrolase n=1 Tax=Ruegeria sp. HKCCD4332 TaxID=2683021 RepID=UPI001C10A9B0|nr:alpha/beta hydrolase [Ruegeria sp. HKCCD4332]
MRERLLWGSCTAAFNDLAEGGFGPVVYVLENRAGMYAETVPSSALESTREVGCGSMHLYKGRAKICSSVWTGEIMPTAILNGAKIYYEDTGGEGEAVLFSHGLLFSGAMFETQVAHLRDRFRCITYDHRRQGQSSVTESGYDIDSLTADAAELIRSLDAAPCHFVGLSMGGFVGMRLAAREPSLLKSLTLLETSADPEEPKNAPKYRILNFVARWIGLWAAINQVMPIMFGRSFLADPERAEERKRWSKAIVSSHRIGITRAVKGVISREGCAELLGKIKVPVGIGVGDEDIATVPEKSHRIHNLIATSEWVVFKGAGHSSSIETPDQVTALIERTIQRTLNGRSAKTLHRRQ